MQFDNQYEQRGFFQKYGFAVGIGAVGLVVIGLIVGQMMTKKKEAPRRQQEVVMIRSLPTPPPPPQPKLPEPPKQTVDQMIKQDTITDDEKPDDSPADAPGITTSLVGPGPGMEGVGKSGSGGNRPVLQKQNSPFGWYGRKVIKTVQDALGRNRLTSRAQFGNEVRVWADLSGRITRVKLKGTTGDKAVDQAINEALTGLQLEEPPPAGMPMPIVMRLSALRPG